MTELPEDKEPAPPRAPQGVPTPGLQALRLKAGLSQAELAVQAAREQADHQSSGARGTRAFHHDCAFGGRSWRVAQTAALTTNSRWRSAMIPTFASPF
jgi:hypothetical protein